MSIEPLIRLSFLAQIKILRPEEANTSDVFHGGRARNGPPEQAKLTFLPILT